MGVIKEFLVLFKERKTASQIDDIVQNLHLENAEYTKLRNDTERSEEFNLDIYLGTVYMNKNDDDKIIGLEVVFTNLEQACLRFITITSTYSYRLNFDSFHEILEGIPNIECVHYISEDDELGCTYDMNGIRKLIDDFNEQINEIREIWKQRSSQ